MTFDTWAVYYGFLFKTTVSRHSKPQLVYPCEATASEKTQFLMKL